MPSGDCCEKDGISCIENVLHRAGAVFISISICSSHILIASVKMPRHDLSTPLFARALLLMQAVRLVFGHG
jgi:hypothetical protein